MNKRIAVVLSLSLALLAACRRSESPAPAGEPAKAAGRADAPAAPAGTNVGSTIPDYSAKWLDGSKFNLADRRGRVVLLNVWATWCPPCRYEIPELQRLHDANKARGFEVIGVSVDEGAVDEVRGFVAEKSITYPIVHDPESKLATLLQTSVLPTSVLLDRNGRIVWKKYGAVFEDDPELAKALASAL